MKGLVIIIGLAALAVLVGCGGLMVILYLRIDPQLWTYLLVAGAVMAGVLALLGTVAGLLWGWSALQRRRKLDEQAEQHSDIERLSMLTGAVAGLVARNSYTVRGGGVSDPAWLPQLTAPVARSTVRPGAQIDEDNVIDVPARSLDIE